MWLIAVLLRFGGVAPNFVGDNFGFRKFHSRLSWYHSQFGLQREFARNDLIWLTVFAAKWPFCGGNRKNSRFHGKNREGAPPAMRVMAWRANTAPASVAGRL
jgi:hypothetical protein